MDAQIVAWGHTAFARHEQLSLEDLILQAAAEAIEHAGVDAADIDSIWVGHFNSGMVTDGFPASLVLGLDNGLRFKPATRLENACASGSAAVYAARNSIRCGDSKLALVIGAEKMTALDTAGAARALGGASYQKEEAGLSFPQIFSGFARAYFDAYGDHSEALAQISVKNHHNAMKNPLAQMRREFSVDFCKAASDKNPMIADPLKLSDCSLISDGAAAVILAADDVADRFPRAVRFKAAEQVNDYLPMSRRDLLAFEGPAQAFKQAFSTAGISVHDLDFAEVHDCFTIAELLVYEAMGLAPRGEAANLLQQGVVMADGSLPINLSGGLKAKGHPVGATGVSMHALAAMQLTGAAGAMQRDGAALGCVFNMGGSGVANYCSILEAHRSDA